MTDKFLINKSRGCRQVWFDTYSEAKHYFSSTPYCLGIWTPENEKGKRRRIH